MRLISESGYRYPSFSCVSFFLAIVLSMCEADSGSDLYSQAPDPNPETSRSPPFRSSPSSVFLLAETGLFGPAAALSSNERVPQLRINTNNPQPQAARPPSDPKPVKFKETFEGSEHRYGSDFNQSISSFLLPSLANPDAQLVFFNVSTRGYPFTTNNNATLFSYGEIVATAGSCCVSCFVYS